MTNEAIYVKNLHLGIQNYVQPIDDSELSLEILQAKNKIFGNIKEIYELHATLFFPALQSCNGDGLKIAETFTKFFKGGEFYCYTLFMLKRERALQLFQDYKDFFVEIRTKGKDRLDVSSFLLQPVQRLPRYQLLLTEIKNELANQRTLVNVDSQMQTIYEAEEVIDRFMVMSNESLSINEIIREDLVRELNNCHHLKIS
jgi:RhoGEF domain